VSLNILLFLCSNYQHFIDVHLLVISTDSLDLFILLILEYLIRLKTTRKIASNSCIALIMSSTRTNPRAQASTMNKSATSLQTHHTNGSSTIPENNDSTSNTTTE
jgi:hypothetical protein